LYVASEPWAPIQGRTLPAEDKDGNSAASTTTAAALARIARDLRYFQARKDSARLVKAAPHPGQVRFGARASLRIADGSERSFQLVGEDEADPAAGLISYVSPRAGMLMGKSVGDKVSFGAQTAEIIALTS